MPSQLPLPLVLRPAQARGDFIVAPANQAAVAFIDAWPEWPANVAALHGPSGSGKSHLIAVWQERSRAQCLKCAELCEDEIAGLDPDRPVAVEDVDMVPASPERDEALFALLERAQLGAHIVLTGRQPPQAWPFNLPDLGSRFASLLAFPLWEPDDALLEALTRKLFTDRQLDVSDSVVMRMIRSLERSPAAIRDFIAEADARALAEKRAVSLGLIRELLARREAS